MQKILYSLILISLLTAFPFSGKAVSTIPKDSQKDKVEKQQPTSKKFLTKAFNKKLKKATQNEFSDKKRADNMLVIGIITAILFLTSLIFLNYGIGAAIFILSEILGLYTFISSLILFLKIKKEIPHQKNRKIRTKIIWSMILSGLVLSTLLIAFYLDNFT